MVKKNKGKKRKSSADHSKNIAAPCPKKTRTDTTPIPVKGARAVVAKSGAVKGNVSRKPTISQARAVADKSDAVVGPGNVFHDKKEESVPAISIANDLRPIVIDGTNVALEHGKVSRTFSSRGIEIAVKHFLGRGHPQVTALVPNFRRSKQKCWKCEPTTDLDTLEALSDAQLVVFTPARVLSSGEGIASDDKRFVVELATEIGGVIVSNHQFEDLESENDSFKETIQKRLLMYCFVGDLFMIPCDPLGSDGPNIDEFLSFNNS